MAQSVKNPPARQETAYTGDPGSKTESARRPGEENDNLLQCSCLEIPWTEEVITFGHNLATKPPAVHSSTNESPTV